MAGLVDMKACDGVLSIRKPMGWTSHDVVGRLRRLLGFQKIGHAGTLDPAATGVLPILLGKGTRISEYLIAWDKEYEGVLSLGQATDTQDATGVVVRESRVDHVTDEMIRSAMGEFHGDIQQVPPMYSAVKVGGQPLYKSARRGKVVERQARQVTIHRLEILGVQGHEVSFRVACSKGTYIRTLCADIGERLGVGGHLRSLERVRVGPLRISDALMIEAFGDEPFDFQASWGFLTLDAALSSLPEVTVDTSLVPRVMNGAPIPFPDPKEHVVAYSGSKQLNSVFRVKDPLGRLLGLGKCVSPSGAESHTLSQLCMMKVLAEPSQCAGH